MKPRFKIEQVITAFVNKYRVFVVNEDGSKAGLCAFVQQKRFAFKEKVTFYADEKKTSVLFTLRAEKVLDVHGRYIVEDPNVQFIGVFKKDFGKSLVSSTWHILDSANNPSLTVAESDASIAVMRRYIGYVPLIGDLLNLIMVFIKYHFSFTTPDGREVGMYRKTTLLRDHYTLSMDDATFSTQDWRVLVSVAIALDALQSR